MSIELTNPLVFLVPALFLFGGYLLGRFGNSRKREREAVAKALREKEAQHIEAQKKLSDSLSKELGSMREGLISTIRSYQQAVKVCSTSLPLSSETQSNISLLIDESAGAHSQTTAFDTSASDTKAATADSATSGSLASSSLQRESLNKTSPRNGHHLSAKPNNGGAPTSRIKPTSEKSDHKPSFEERYAELVKRKNQEDLESEDAHNMDESNDAGRASEDSKLASASVKPPRGPGAPAQPTSSEGHTRR